MDIDVISLEDNKKYFIVDTIIDEDNKYLFLVDRDNDKNITVRKVIKKDDQEYVVKLDSSTEFEEVMALFNAKYREE